MSDTRNWSVTFQEENERGRKLREQSFELHMVQERDLAVAVKNGLRREKVKGFSQPAKIFHFYDGKCMMLETRTRKARVFITEMLF